MKKIAMVFVLVTLLIIGFLQILSLREYSPSKFGKAAQKAQSERATAHLSQMANVPEALELGEMYQLPEDRIFITASASPSGERSAILYSSKSNGDPKITTLAVVNNNDDIQKEFTSETLSEIGNAYSLKWNAEDGILFSSRRLSSPSHDDVMREGADMFLLDLETGKVEKAISGIDATDHIVGTNREKVLLANQSNGTKVTITAYSLASGTLIDSFSWEPWSSDDFNLGRFGAKTSLDIGSFALIPDTEVISFLVKVHDSPEPNRLVGLDMSSHSFSELIDASEVSQNAKIESFAWSPGGILWLETGDYKLYVREGSDIRVFVSSSAPFTLIGGARRGVLLSGARKFGENATYDDMQGHWPTVTRPFWLGL